MNSGKQNINKINYMVVLYLFENMLNFTTVSYNPEISLPLATATLYLNLTAGLPTQPNLEIRDLFPQTHASSTSVPWLPLRCYFFLTKTTSATENTLLSLFRKQMQ